MLRRGAGKVAASRAVIDRAASIFLCTKVYQVSPKQAHSFHPLPPIKWMLAIIARVAEEQITLTVLEAGLFSMTSAEVAERGAEVVPL
jgi:hypothetical protein